MRLLKMNLDLPPNFYSQPGIGENHLGNFVASEWQDGELGDDFICNFPIGTLCMYVKNGEEEMHYAIYGGYIATILCFFTGFDAKSQPIVFEMQTRGWSIRRFQRKVRVLMSTPYLEG